MDSATYIAYLLSEPGKASCVRASEVVGISHDEVNRFLVSCTFQGKDLFEAVKDILPPEGGVLSLDDTVLDKPFSAINSSELVGRFYSGRHHAVVVGINLITLHYSWAEDMGVPINFRLYRQADGKSKHDYFREMLAECLDWGIHPAWLTADSWYASLDNLKFLKYKGIGFMIGLENNRIISTAPHCYQQVGKVQIPEEGLYTHLKGFDFVKVFRTVDENHHARHYAMYKNDPSESSQLDSKTFQAIRLFHWNIEKSYRLMKQHCHAAHFLVRDTSAVTTHLFCVLRAFQRLVLMTKDRIIENLYALQRKLYLQVQRQFILDFA